MRGKLHAYDTLLAGLAQDLHDMAAELRQFIDKKHAVVSPRHVARHRHVAPADQPRIRDGVVRRATRAGRDPRHAVAGAARDTVDARGLNGLGEGIRRQDGGEPPGEHRLARPRGAEQEDVMRRTPAYHFASPVPLGMPMDLLLNRLVKLPNQSVAIS
jgi:hypothetical protein